MAGVTTNTTTKKRKRAIINGDNDDKKPPLQFGKQNKHILFQKSESGAITICITYDKWEVACT